MSQIVVKQNSTDATPNAIETIYDNNVFAVARQYNGISRYRDILLIQDEADANTFAHVNLYSFSIPLSDKDIIVTADEFTRLDILADKYYSNATFWWVIAMASNIKDPFNIYAGQLIRIPPLKSLYDDYSVLARR